ncbi:ERMES complex subunit MDM12 ASCRUDRAFT_29456 [Ascoidea rubescens DSM 1968]|uniref:Mitochondrial distribution and morphology protein 12 n=1 Tax=Ascoidea rubescens DSM 1968 TaxID=1344418 RepID=A0A1D2VQM8_9ASCO|nr:hypothetical protein ASCRUDRAFT_29456 [Ascoidea rubescens DSM 1968]ODV63912.1 hypothetical protein ASCRUDRAFT_29456 [Ascoidea rubescens DSM 1968]
MSFDINWDQLATDAELNLQFQQFLDRQFKSISFPPYITDVCVTNFQLGSIPPEITIRHIGDPFPEFYTDDDDNDNDNDDDDDDGSDTSTNPTPSISNEIGNDSSNNGNNINSDNATSIKSKLKSENDPNDIQFIIEIDYKGNLSIEISASLLLNYPFPGFIQLPVKLKLTNLVIHSLAILSYCKRLINFSFLCDINDPITNSTPPNIASTSTSNRSLIDIIKNIKIESEIGNGEPNNSSSSNNNNNNNHTSVLRNVGKVEKFLIEKIQSILRDELGWPGWISFDFSSTDDSGDDALEADSSSFASDSDDEKTAVN